MVPYTSDNLHVTSVRGWESHDSKGLGVGLILDLPRSSKSLLSQPVKAKCQSELTDSAGGFSHFWLQHFLQLLLTTKLHHRSVRWFQIDGQLCWKNKYYFCMSIWTNMAQLEPCLSNVSGQRSKRPDVMDSQDSSSSDDKVLMINGRCGNVNKNWQSCFCRFVKKYIGTGCFCGKLVEFLNH